MVDRSVAEVEREGAFLEAGKHHLGPLRDWHKAHPPPVKGPALEQARRLGLRHAGHRRWSSGPLIDRA